MRLTSNQVRGQLLLVWPALREIWARDPIYWAPTPKELHAFLSETTTHLRPQVANIADCDDFALQLHAEISRMRYDYIREHLPPYEERAPWPFGEVSGLKFRGKPSNHTLNICNTTDGVYLIDATTNNKTWKATPGQDEIFFHII